MVARKAGSIAALKSTLQQLRDRGSPREFTPPLSQEQLLAVETQLGFALPDDVRTFYGQLSAGELDTAGYPILFPLAQGLSLGDSAPSKPFAFSTAQAQSLIEKLSKHKAPAPMPALQGPMHGVLVLRDQGDGVYDCMVLRGEQAGLMWQRWDGGWTPLLLKKRGKIQHHSFASLVTEHLTEALEQAPAPVLPDSKSISLSGLRLTHVPPSVLQAKAAEVLVLANNQLSFLPPELAALRALRELNLNSNALTELPEWIDQYSHLTRLSLGSNRLCTLAGSIGNLSVLEHLDLQNNQLKELPPTLSGLQCLHLLDLKRNALTALPDSIGELKALRQLELSSNPIQSLPESFACLSLEHLELEHMSQLDWAQALGVLSAMPSLRDLLINQGTLGKALDRLAELKSLRSLQLIGLGLCELPSSVLQLDQLEALSLFQNQLQTLPEPLGAMPKLKSVMLFDNPLPSEELARLRQKWPHLKIKHPG